MSLEQQPRLLYIVNFMTYGRPDPNRLGTAELQGARIQLWAKNADEAIDLARKIAQGDGVEYLQTLSADSVTGVVLEQIANDPLNPFNKLASL